MFSMWWYIHLIVLLSVCEVIFTDFNLCRMEMDEVRKLAEEKKREKMEERLAR